MRRLRLLRRFLLVGLVGVCGFGQTPQLLLSEFGLPAQIESYLGLTSAEGPVIRRQIDSFNAWAGRKSSRIYDVQVEIDQETAREPLDPAALGVRYAEIEAIRREIVERNVGLIAENVAVLTDVQRGKLQVLAEAVRLAPIATWAHGAKLLRDPCTLGGDSGFSVFFTGVVRPTCAGGGPNVIPASRTGLSAEVIAYLGLTPEQQQMIARENLAFGRWSDEKLGRSQQVYSEIDAETGREPLDPSALGVRYAEVEAIRREIVDRETRLIAENAAALSDAQKGKLRALEEAVRLGPTVEAAQRAKLLPDNCGATVPRLVSTFAGLLLGYSGYLCSSGGVLGF